MNCRLDLLNTILTWPTKLFNNPNLDKLNLELSKLSKNICTSISTYLLFFFNLKYFIEFQYLKNANKILLNQILNLYIQSIYISTCTKSPTSLIHS